MGHIFNRRLFLSGASAAAAALAIKGCHQAARGGGEAASGDKPPNRNQKPFDVIFVAFDDLSPHSLGCHGNTVCRTPNIDALAGRSARFELAHAASAACIPSRTSLLRCLWPQTTGVVSNFTPDRHKWKDDPNAWEAVAHFANNGYLTACSGKVAHNTFPKRSLNWEMPKDPSAPKPAVGRELEKHYYCDKTVNGENPYYFNFGPSGLKDEDEGDWRKTSNVIRALHEKPDKPIFLALGLQSTHSPWTAPDRFFDMYPAKDMVVPEVPAGDMVAASPKYQQPELPHNFPKEVAQRVISAHYACTSWVDEQVGRVWKAVQETGRADSTIIVLWSDHGLQLGQHGFWGKGPLMDNSARCVLAIRVPGLTDKGTVCPRPVDSIDIFPTLFECCGVPVPPGIEGISMMPLLKDPLARWKTGATTIGCDLKAVGRSVRTERYRYSHYSDDDSRELFDYQNDPDERTNRAADPAYADIKKELHAIIRPQKA